MTDYAGYGEQARGYDHQGEPISLVQRRSEPKLEIIGHSGPTYQETFETERRTVVKAEDDEFAKNLGLPPFDMGKAMIERTWLDLHCLAHTLEKMPNNQRDKWRPQMNELAWSLENVAKRVRALAA